MRALSIRQPWAELILLGHKTIEVRSKRTNLRERVFIYAELNRIEPAEEARISPFAYQMYSKTLIIFLPRLSILFDLPNLPNKLTDTHPITIYESIYRAEI